MTFLPPNQQRRSTEGITRLLILATLCRKKNSQIAIISQGSAAQDGTINKPFDADLTGFRHEKSQINTDVARSQLCELSEIQVRRQTNFLTEHFQYPDITKLTRCNYN